MTRPLRFGSAASAIVLATMIAGCAAPQVKTSFGGPADENVGLATRALAALNSNNLPLAVDLAERAVDKSPNDAGFRALLGNAYFVSGRFRSAESAYKDSLTIYSNQPQVILKLALVETALGKKDQAVAFLDAGKSVLNPSNYGLALALAGRPDDAVAVLEAAAREPGADGTVRQNLALAHALAGDWSEARTIAAQDVPGNQLDARIQQWMLLASPKGPAEQIAAFVGVKPAPTDQGEPVRLALRKTDTMMAAAAPAPAPKVAVPAAKPQVALAAPQPVVPPFPKFMPAVATPASAVKAAPAVALAPAAPKSMVAQAEALAAVPLAAMASAAHQAAAEVASFLPRKSPAIAKPTVRRIAAVARRGNPDVVMQIGSYRSPQQVSAGWSHLTQHYPALRAYLPLRARFDSPKGTFWRLSIQGFGNQREAIARCNTLKSRGGHCFVRGAAGDAPVEIASN
ncbi:MAG TPA: tetratricopeptide repeat protein [Sphingomicrobium sp.]